MLFYFQFLATPRAAQDAPAADSMVAHVLIDSLGVDPAAQEVVRLMSSVSVDVKEVRRACPIRRVEDLSIYRNLTLLYADAERDGHAILFEMLRDGETIPVPARPIRLAAMLPSVDGESASS